MKYYNLDNIPGPKNALSITFNMRKNDQMLLPKSKINAY